MTKAVVFVFTQENSMSGYKELELDNGKLWGVGSFLLANAIVIVPIDQLDDMTNEDIGAYVRALAPYAASLMADEFLYNWDGDYQHSPPKYAKEFYDILQPHEDFDEYTEKAAWLLDALVNGREILVISNKPKEAPRPRKPKFGFVYLARSSSDHYKIGISKDPVSRVSQLVGTTGPYDVELLRSVHVQEPRGVESELHNQFNHCHVMGEWFDFNQVDLSVLHAMFDRLEQTGSLQ
jgi:hypothetical protein